MEPPEAIRFCGIALKAAAPPWVPFYSCEGLAHTGGSRTRQMSAELKEMLTAAARLMQCAVKAPRRSV